MKKIEAIIRPFKMDEVKNALRDIGIEEMTVSQVQAFGRQRSSSNVYRGTEVPAGSLPEIKIELVLQDSQMDAAVSAILKGTKLDKRDGDKVFVSQIDNAIGRVPERVAAEVV